MVKSFKKSARQGIQNQGFKREVLQSCPSCFMKSDTERNGGVLELTDYPAASCVGPGSVQGRVSPQTLLTKWAGTISAPSASQSVDSPERALIKYTWSVIERPLLTSVGSLNVTPTA